MACEATKPGQKVQWFKNGKPLKTDAKKGIKISSKDISHTLSIAKCSKEDAGEYTAQVGNETSTANLFVDGKLTVSGKCAIKQEVNYLFYICCFSVLFILNIDYYFSLLLLSHASCFAYGFNLL